VAKSSEVSKKIIELVFGEYNDQSKSKWHWLMAGDTEDIVEVAKDHINSVEEQRKGT